MGNTAKIRHRRKRRLERARYTASVIAHYMGRVRAGVYDKVSSPPQKDPSRG